MTHAWQAELPKQYDHQSAEERWYRFWKSKGYFQAKVDPNRKPFTIVMPPPNVTGALHMGHAMDNVISAAAAFLALFVWMSWFGIFSQHALWVRMLPFGIFVFSSTVFFILEIARFNSTTSFDFKVLISITATVYPSLREVNIGFISSYTFRTKVFIRIEKKTRS